MNKIFAQILFIPSICIAIFAIIYLPDDKWLIVIGCLAQVALLAATLYINRRAESEAVASLKDECRRADAAEKYIIELQEYAAGRDRANEFLHNDKEKFRHASLHDTLTNLPNRTFFIETLKFKLEKHKQSPNYNFAVLLLNLNRFKTVNDSLGHSIGDRLIVKVADRLSGLLREGDLIARFAGDEFGIIVSDTHDSEEIAKLADRIKRKMALPFLINQKEVFSSVSIGAAVGRKNYAEVEEIIHDADIALYRAKEKGTGIEIFNQTMQSDTLRVLQIETDLRRALERGEFSAYFQPIVELGSLRLVGFEALIRWKHPKKGFISPAEFIPISEELKLIVPITLWMLRHSCGQLVQWQKRNPNDQNLFVSVNLSGKHFQELNLIDEMKKIIAETKIAPACLKLEITESAVMENAETAISMIQELRNIGIQLSIDDFGTGYSSLSYLHRFPIDMLKVDRSFVNTMEDGSDNGEIVHTVIALAKTLRMNVVAEGIETVHQLHQLRILKCQYGQGYLFSPPVAADEAETLLQDKTRWQRMLTGIIAPVQAPPDLLEASVPPPPQILNLTQ